jgi:hypothetical protein
VGQTIARLRSLRELRRIKLAITSLPPQRAKRAGAGGKSELRRAVRRVTPGQGNLKESGTENIPPAEAPSGVKAGKGEKVR